MFKQGTPDLFHSGGVLACFWNAHVQTYTALPKEAAALPE
jgi:hypothetical protein